ncbi:MAG TPA: hypothetical protein VFJ90_16785 [Candidatus Didemnitutus sp.]|nr:hypothetical protein [Candidatus Didemnitutus sp.]
MNRKMSPEELEQFIHQQLRGLPARKAPRTLESRVMAAIEHQASIPWYHKSWNHWPAAVRSAFLAVATGIAGAAVIGFYLMTQGVDAGAVASEVGSHFEWAFRLVSVATWIVNFTNYLISSIPSVWLYSGLAILAALYAAFFGLGAAAYRTLYRNN